MPWMSQLDIKSSMEMAVPATQVWEVVSDFARNPQWQKGMQSCTWLTEPPVAVGSRYEQHARFLRKDVMTTFEVIELDPGRLVTIDTVEGTFPITVTRTVVPTAGGCRVVANVRGDAGGIFGLITPLMRLLVKRSVTNDYRRLKALLED